jgi:hypothetical protein
MIEGWPSQRAESCAVTPSHHRSPLRVIEKKKRTYQSYCRLPKLPLVPGLLLCWTSAFQFAGPVSCGLTPGKVVKGFKGPNRGNEPKYELRMTRAGSVITVLPLQLTAVCCPTRPVQQDELPISHRSAAPIPPAGPPVLLKAKPKRGRPPNRHVIQ